MYVTPSGSHPDVDVDLVPGWLRIFNLIVLFLALGAIIGGWGVKIAKGLFILAIGSFDLIGLRFNYRSYSRLLIILNLIIDVSMVSFGLYLIFKHQL